VPDLRELPGHDLFSQGVADLAAGRTTEAALLVAMARTRLTQAGLEVPGTAELHVGHALYDLLANENGADAHSRYNALLRRIVSFARAAEHAASR
jgi:hypothetical protein